MIKDAVFRVVINKEVLEPPKTKEEIQGKVIGMETTQGTPGAESSLEGPKGDGQGIVEQPVTALVKPVFIVDQMPAFNGDLSQFLNEHLHYPDEARAAGDEGRVGIQFVVNEDGSISNVEVTHKAGALLDAEALRVVRSMPHWKPGKQGGKAMKVYFTLPITFQLD